MVEESIEARLGRLEKHVGVTAKQLRWEEYVEEYTPSEFESTAKRHNGRAKMRPRDDDILVDKDTIAIIDEGFGWYSIGLYDGELVINASHPRDFE